MNRKESCIVVFYKNHKVFEKLIERKYESGLRIRSYKIRPDANKILRMKSEVIMTFKPDNPD